MISRLPVYILLGLLMFGCENKPAEVSDKESTKDSTVVKKETPAEEVKAPALSGKAAVVSKKWKAKEVALGNLVLPEGAIDLKYDFKSDGAFSVTEGGVMESGKWNVDDEGKVLTFEYAPNRKATYKVKELQDDKMIMEGKENDVFRKVTLIPEI